VVLSTHFAELAARKFSFYSIDINSVDQLPLGQREQIKKLMEENEVVETPSLLFLNPDSLTKKHLYCGADDLEASLIVSQIAAELQ